MCEQCRGGRTYARHFGASDGSRWLAGGVLPADCTAAGSHGPGVPAAVRLGRALERLPRQVVILAVEGADTGPGTGLSDAVAAAVPQAVAAVMAELKRIRSPDKPRDAAPRRKRQGSSPHGD